MRNPERARWAHVVWLVLASWEFLLVLFTSIFPFLLDVQ